MRYITYIIIYKAKAEIWCYAGEETSRLHTCSFTHLDKTQVDKILDLIPSESDSIHLLFDYSHSLTANIEVKDIPKRKLTDVIRYKIEEILPVKLDMIAFDYIVNEGEAFAVVQDVELIRLFVDGLADKGLSIKSISCLELAIAQIKEFDDSCVYIETDGVVQRIILKNGRPTIWQAVRTERERIDDERCLIASDCVKDIVAPIEVSKTKLWLNVIKNDSFNVKRNNKILHDSILKSILFILMVLLAGIVLRVSYYQNLLTLQSEKQIAIFNEIYPDQDPPVNIKSRIVTQLKSFNQKHIEGSVSKYKTKLSLLTASSIYALVDAKTQIVQYLDVRQDRVKLSLYCSSMQSVDQVRKYFKELCSENRLTVAKSDLYPKLGGQFVLELLAKGGQ